MSLDLRLVARLEAWRRGRAVRVSSTRQVHLSPAARALCPLQLAGEDATLHAFTWGPLDGPPAFHFVADPRAREDQHALFATLGRTLDAWARESVARGELPQLWLPSAAALTLLDVLAERLRGQREDEPGHLLAARLFTFLRQSHLEGCQAVVVATEALCAHWATGQQPGEDGHLGSLLLWLDPPADPPLQEALAAAGRTPMSTKTRPELDREVLEPALRAWGRARRAGDEARKQAEEAQIGAALRATAEPIHAATQRAFAALQQSGLQDMPGLAELVKRDLDAFAWELNPPEPEEGKPKANPVGRAAVELVKAEDALEQHAATLVHGDEVALAAARARGEAVLARIVSAEVEKRGRSTSCRLALVTRQAVSRLRPGDAVALRGLRGFTLRILEVHGGSETVLVAELREGIRRARELTVGLCCDLVPPPPKLGAVAGTIQRMNLRLAERPWTHAEQLPSPDPDTRAPGDPLHDVEHLRLEHTP